MRLNRKILGLFIIFVGEYSTRLLFSCKVIERRHRGTKKVEALIDFFFVFPYNYNGFFINVFLFQTSGKISNFI
jgi:hypothetical protein